VVGAGAPLTADGLRPPLATRRRPRQHGLRAGHLLPGQLPDRRRRRSKAPEESLARGHHAHDCSCSLAVLSQQTAQLMHPGQ
jgi:hypothetical protein